MSSCRFMLKDNATLVSVDDERVLLDAERRCYYSMNDAAFFVLQLAESGCTVDAARRALVSRFDVVAQTATVDLDRFVSEAAALGLVRVDQGEEAAPLGMAPPEPPPANRQPYTAPALERDSELLTAVAQVTPLTLSVSI